MRDYKNVKVPRRYRREAARASVKRVDVGGRKTGRRPNFKGTLLNVLAVAATVGACWVGWQAYRTITHAEMFQVAGVDVKGLQHLGPDDLKPIVGGFRGQNIFRVDLETAVQRARTNGWIRDVSIRRSLPNRISMTVTERTPFAVLDADGGRYLVDSEGFVIDRAGSDPISSKLPLLQIKDIRPRPGEPAASDGIADGLELLGLLQARGGWNLEQVSIKASSPDALSLTYGGNEFRIGSGNYEEKLRRLAEVMEDVKQRNLEIAYVDLRPDNQAAVMVKQPRKTGAALPSRHGGSRRR